MPVGWQWWSCSNYKVGEGFTMKGTWDKCDNCKWSSKQPWKQQRYDFRGKPNDGTHKYPLVVAVHSR
jgi:hypothetical protein